MTGKEIVHCTIVGVLGILSLCGIIYIADMNSHMQLQGEIFDNGRIVYATGICGQWQKHNIEMVRINDKWYGKPMLLFLKPKI